jgi:protein TonB
MTRFTPPRIVRDIEVKAQEKPPVQEKLEDSRIGTIDQEGIKDEGFAMPASDAGKGIGASGPNPGGDYDRVFMKVEIESQYPGGIFAWQRFLNKNMHYPDQAINNLIQGMIMVQFIVDKDGDISDVQPISGTDQGGLQDEAIRVIRASGKWIPAIQNGRQVRSFKKQPIVFMLSGH